MQAKILSGEGKFNHNHRREKYFQRVFTGVAYAKGSLRCPVDLRIYETPSRTYACIWIRGRMVSKSGSGYAGGYGYHRESAAAGEAIENAGIQLSERIHGAGDEAIRRAILAIVRELFPDAEDVSVFEVSA